MIRYESMIAQHNGLKTRCSALVTDRDPIGGSLHPSGTREASSVAEATSALLSRSERLAGVESGNRQVGGVKSLQGISRVIRRNGVRLGGPIRRIMFDARCLQDFAYRYRGVGQHSATLVRTMRGELAGDIEAIAFCDPELPNLDDAHAVLFDRVIANVYDAGRHLDCFVQLSPMTHSGRRLRRILLDPAIYKIAVAYDLIQFMDVERYLGAPATRAAFMANCGFIRSYHRLMPLSRFTAEQFTSHLGVDPARLTITGCAVRSSLLPAKPIGYDDRAGRAGIVVAGGGDPRKNPDCAVLAHAMSAQLQAAKASLFVTGNYGELERLRLRELSKSIGGDPDLIAFAGHLTDAELAAVYRGSLITVVPSFAEGFSMPPIEANANGSVVLASDATAHPELLLNPAHRFAPSEPGMLSRQLEALVVSEVNWLTARLEQAELWTRFTTEKVGRRFWSALVEHDLGNPVATALAVPNVTTGRQPSLAVVSPLPPALSGVADYSARFLRVLSDVADVHVFTPTGRPVAQPWYKSLQAVSSKAYVSREFDRTVSIIGNSAHHLEAFQHLLDYGGACVAHDARMLSFYYHDLSQERARKLACRELGREVAFGELKAWLQEEGTMECLFLSELCERAEPTFVHSAATVDLIKAASGTQPILLPFALYGPVTPAEVSSNSIKAARNRLGLTKRQFVVATFGIVSPEKAPETCLQVLALLRDMGHLAHLTFCGFAWPESADRLRKTADVMGMSEYVTIMTDRVDIQLYRDWLLAADASIQLRTYGLGGLSGALNDCIGAALPCVVNESLAIAMQAPPFVRRVSDALPPEEIANALTEIAASTVRPVAEASEHALRFSFEEYCKKMLHHLEYPAVAHS